jgi:hypothetical protein
MPLKSYREEVRDLILDMLWSLWAELGAGGWERRHPATAVDVEPLIMATNHPRLQQLDRRLLEQALDWSIANVRLVSAVRLRNLLKDFPPQLAESFGAFAATVRGEANANWPGDGTALRARSAVSPFARDRAPMPDLTRPSLLQLRLRAAWGVSARAEIIRLLLGEPSSFLSVSELAGGAAFGRDNVADAVEMMARAGIVRERGTGGSRRYQLAKREPGAMRDHDPWVALLGPLPETFPDWAARFRIMLAVLDFAHAELPDPLVRAAEITRFRREHATDMARNSIVFAIRRPGPSAEEPNQDFEEESLRLLRDWSGRAESPTSAVGRRARSKQ